MDPTASDVAPSSVQQGRAPDIARQLDRSRLWICVSYLGAGLFWIAAGDILIERFVGAPRLSEGLQTFAALLYLAATTCLLYLLLRWLTRRLVQAQEKLARSQAGYRQLFDGHPNPMWIYDPRTLIVLDANDAAIKAFGWPRSDLVGLSVKTLWSDPDNPLLEKATARMGTGIGNPDSAIYLLRTSSGVVRQMEIHSLAIGFGGIPALLAIGQDRTTEIDARHQREEAIARMQEAQRIARLGSWELNPATGHGYFSDELYRILGRRPPVQRWHHFRELLAPGDEVADRIDQRIADLADGDEKPWHALLPIQVADRGERWLEIQADPFRDGTGKRMLRGTLQDVSEREQGRRQLQEREERFRDLVGTLPDGVMILEEEQVVYANTACAALLGHVRSTLPGRTLAALVAEPDLARVRAWLAAANPGTALAPAPRMRRRDGAEFPAGLSVGTTRYGGRECRLLIVRDLAEPERMRDALALGNVELQAMAKRLFSLQEDERRAISRDLHDDIGQTITAMKLSAHAALGETDNNQRDEDLREIAMLADAAIGRLRDLSTLLRPPQLDALGLEAALRSQAAMLFRTSSVRLVLDIHALPQRPEAEIEQACFRIAQESLTNALRHARATEVSLWLSDEQGRIRLRVADDGNGFDPHATRGLGMIVMRERAQSLGGHLRIDTAPGAGTCIDLDLPYLAAALVEPLIIAGTGWEKAS